MSSQRDHAEFERLLQRITAAVDRTDIEGALALAEDAIAWGQRHHDQDAIDRGAGNRAMMLINLGRGDEVAREQQTILMRSRDAVNRYFAAYNLSVLNDHRQAYDKSRFYASLALEHARASDNPVFLGRGLNRMANVLVAQSYFLDAIACCEEAIGLGGAESSIERCLMLANLGYCRLMEGQTGAGFQALFECLRALRRLGATEWERLSGVRLSLCYGYLEVDRPDLARRHGLAARRAAIDAGDHDRLQKALYLLGEAEKRAGRPLDAYSYFRELQNDYFADDIDLANMLMYAETHKLVNLLA